MIEVKESRQPITRRVINRLAPHLQKMCAELGVKYVDFKEEKPSPSTIWIWK